MRAGPWPFHGFRSACPDSAAGAGRRSVEAAARSPHLVHSLSMSDSACCSGSGVITLQRKVLPENVDPFLREALGLARKRLRLGCLMSHSGRSRTSANDIGQNRSSGAVFLLSCGLSTSRGSLPHALGTTPHVLIRARVV